MNSPDGNSKPANSRTVLVLDDDVLVRMPVVQFLRDCGYRVVEAASTDEATVILQKTNIPRLSACCRADNDQSVLRAVSSSRLSLRRQPR
jgi:CheY-like chemotaxis protein